MKRVGIYLRVSTEEQARVVDGSLVSQKNRLEEYVAGQNRRENGWGTIIDVYCDEAKSGKNLVFSTSYPMETFRRSAQVAKESYRILRRESSQPGLSNFQLHFALFVTAQILKTVAFIPDELQNISDGDFNEAALKTWVKSFEIALQKQLEDSGRPPMAFSKQKDSSDWILKAAHEAL